MLITHNLVKSLQSIIHLSRKSKSQDHPSADKLHPALVTEVLHNTLTVSHVFDNASIGRFRIATSVRDPANGSIAKFCQSRVFIDPITAVQEHLGRHFLHPIVRHG